VLVAKLGGREATLDHRHQGLPVLWLEGEFGLELEARSVEPGFGRVEEEATRPISTCFLIPLRVSPNGPVSSPIVAGPHPRRSRIPRRSIPEWGADGPSGDKRLPLVVITHSEPDEDPANGVYSFATGGIEAALEEARDRADGGDIAIMGGPSVGGQCLRAGLVDEVALNVVPVLLGARHAAV
jgi:RibD C-terminal domain